MAEKRREKGTGSVRPDVSRPGKWVGRRWTGAWIGSVQIEGRRYYARGDSKTDVSAKLAQHKAKALTGVPKADGKATVAQSVDLFLERDLPNRMHNGRPLTPSTMVTYRWAADIIRAELGKVRLASLTPDKVEAMYDRLAARDHNPLNVASLRKLHSMFTRMVTFAEKRKLVSGNVVRLATITPDARPSTTRRALAPTDARKLFAALRHERNGVMFALGLRLGLRPGEAAGLYWSDVTVDASPALVNVTRAVRMTKGRAEVVDDLKTNAAKRTLALPDDITAWLRSHRDAQRAEPVTPAKLVFASPTGHVLDPKNVRRQLADVCTRAGVPVITPNELRHSCASLLADEGVSHEAIADLLGHTTTRMVDSTYRHRLRPVVDIAARVDWTATN